MVTSKFNTAGHQAMEAVLVACRQEFARRGAQGDLSRQVKGAFDPVRNKYSLNMNIFTAMQLGFNDVLMTLGQYAVRSPEGEPDIVHMKAENGALHTSNFEALKSALNEKFLSPENQIKYSL